MSKLSKILPVGRAVPAAGALALLLLAACATPPGAEPARTPDARTPESRTPDASKPATVLLLGDSISIGYTATVKEELADVAIVVRATREDGRTENCEGTNKGSVAIDRWLALPPGEGGWDLVHVNFGLHDLKRVHPETGKNSNDPAHPNQADLGAYERQLAGILDRAIAASKEVVVATTTPVPLGVKPHREELDVQRYNAVARRLAAERGLPVDDLHAFALERLEEIQQPANVHFSKEGSASLGREVARVLRGVLAGG